MTELHDGLTNDARQAMFDGAAQRLPAGLVGTPQPIRKAQGQLVDLNLAVLEAECRRRSVDLVNRADLRAQPDLPTHESDGV